MSFWKGGRMGHLDSSLTDGCRESKKGRVITCFFILSLCQCVVSGHLAALAMVQSHCNLPGQRGDKLSLAYM